MRVTVVYPIWIDEYQGGGERYAFELANAIGRRCPTRFITFGKSRHQIQRGFLTIDVFPAVRRLGQAGELFNPINILPLAQLWQTDVVHCIGTRALVLDVAVVLGRLLGKHVAITEMGGGTGVTLHRFHDVRRFADVMLHISAYGARVCACDGPRSEVIFGGVDTERFVPRPDRKDTSRVLYAGRVLPWKGVASLVEAVPHEVPLTIDGPRYDPGYYQSLQASAAGKDIHFVNHTSLDDLVPEYQRATVTVLPSLHSELLGLVLLESMACGTPVICTSVGGMPEVVEDGRTGFVVPPGDVAALRNRIELLTQNPDLARRMGEAGRQAVEHRFSWNAVAQRCVEAYARPRGGGSSHPSLAGGA
jgi:glycosyltransferase involved in cell wall biosynthesis